ncbi:MAG: hypothetical protein M1812_007310 [Candelaria pacifica]|nr:MAG: hypothetical protein M1812_007310 [Candelaria pacifica]
MNAPAGKPSLYFGYGSNLWLHQMAHRCPDSPYLGTAVLHNWRWIINKRGYATVIPSKGDIVYGLVYRLSDEDEQALDINEGVSSGAYVKRTLNIVLFAEGSGEDVDAEGRMIEALVYVDEARTEESTPNEEYVHRMNMGIKDATMKGVPQWYIDLFLRPFIRHEPTNTTEEKARPRVVKSSKPERRNALSN